MEQPTMILHSEILSRLAVLTTEAGDPQAPWIGFARTLHFYRAWDAHNLPDEIGYAVLLLTLVIWTTDGRLTWRR